jgi:hypothetical protein
MENLKFRINSIEIIAENVPAAIQEYAIRLLTAAREVKYANEVALEFDLLVEAELNTLKKTKTFQLLPIADDTPMPTPLDDIGGPEGLAKLMSSQPVSGRLEDYGLNSDSVE